MDRAHFRSRRGGGQSCQWSFAGAVPADADPRQFVAATQRALHAGPTNVSGDCRELRIVVPSDPSDPKAVAGQATVTRTSPDGSQASVTVAPRDRLVIGFGDSFTSGEGNPERLALFSGAALDRRQPSGSRRRPCLAFRRRTRARNGPIAGAIVQSIPGRSARRSTPR